MIIAQVHRGKGAVFSYLTEYVLGQALASPGLKVADETNNRVCESQIATCQPQSKLRVLGPWQDTLPFLRKSLLSRRQNSMD